MSSARTTIEGCKKVLQAHPAFEIRNGKDGIRYDKMTFTFDWIAGRITIEYFYKNESVMILSEPEAFSERAAAVTLTTDGWLEVTYG